MCEAKPGQFHHQQLTNALANIPIFGFLRHCDYEIFSIDWAFQYLNESPY